MAGPFDNISPEKAEFIQQLTQEAGGKSQSELLPFLMSVSKRMSGKHLEFTDEETNLLVKQLTAGLPPKEQKKVELLHRLSRMIVKSQHSQT